MVKKIAAIQSLILAGSLLFSGCSQAAGTTAASSAGTTTASEVTTTTTYNLADYNFTWTDELSEKFSDYCKKKLNLKLTAYVNTFGYTEELQELLGEFVQIQFGQNYDKIPFEKVNYFYSHMYPDSEHYLFRDYNRFSKRFLNGEKYLWGTFNNKLVMSYLISNSIKLGDIVPIEKLKGFYGNKVYGKDPVDICLTNPKIGNYDTSYKYTDEELSLIHI